MEVTLPPYITNPSGNNPVPMLLRGVPGYAFGSKAATQQNTLLQVTAVARSGGTATLTVTMREGNIPAVGSLLTTTGLATSAFNVTNQALTAVSITASTGQGTVQFALAGTTTTTPDAGQGYVGVPEVSETLANGTSQAFAVQEVPVGDTNGLTVTWTTVIAGAPATVTMTLQAAIDNIDSQYASLDSSTNTSGETRFITLTRFRFFRIVASNVTGGTVPTVIAKILV
jgi:hypothetical protein